MRDMGFPWWHAEEDQGGDPWVLETVGCGSTGDIVTRRCEAQVLQMTDNDVLDILILGQGRDNLFNVPQTLVPVLDQDDGDVVGLTDSLVTARVWRRVWWWLV